MQKKSAKRYDSPKKNYQSQKLLPQKSTNHLNQSPSKTQLKPQLFTSNAQSTSEHTDHYKRFFTFQQACQIRYDTTKLQTDNPNQRLNNFISILLDCLEVQQLEIKQLQNQEADLKMNILSFQYELKQANQQNNYLREEVDQTVLKYTDSIDQLAYYQRICEQQEIDLKSLTSELAKTKQSSSPHTKKTKNNLNNHLVQINQSNHHHTKAQQALAYQTLDQNYDLIINQQQQIEKLNEQIVDLNSSLQQLAQLNNQKQTQIEELKEKFEFSTEVNDLLKQQIGKLKDTLNDDQRQHKHYNQQDQIKSNSSSLERSKRNYHYQKQSPERKEQLKDKEIIQLKSQIKQLEENIINYKNVIKMRHQENHFRQESPTRNQIEKDKKIGDSEEIQKYKRQIQTLETRLRKKEQDVISLQKNIDSIKQLQQQQSPKPYEDKLAKKQKSESNAKVKELQEIINQMESEISTANEREKELNLQIQDLKETVKSQKKNILELKYQINQSENKDQNEKNQQDDKQINEENHLYEEINTLEQENEQLKDQIKKIGKQNNQQIEDQKIKFEELFDSNELLKEENQKLKDEIKELAKDTSLKKNLQKTIEENKALQKQVEQLKSELRELKRETNQQTKSQKLKSQKTTEEDKSLLKENEQLKNEIKELKKDLNQSIKDQKGKSQKQTDDNKSLQKENESLKNEIKALKQNNNLLTEDQKNQKIKLQDINEENQSLQEKNKQLKDQIKDLREQINQLTNDQETISQKNKEEKKTLQKQNEQLQDEIKELNININQLTKDKKGLKNDIERLEQQKLELSQQKQSMVDQDLEKIHQSFTQNVETNNHEQAQKEKIEMESHIENVKSGIDDALMNKLSDLESQLKSLDFQLSDL